MELFLNQLVNGISAGSIYAALALALVLIFRSTGILNFAQGEMAMFSAFISWQLAELGLPMWLAIVGSMAISAVGGAIIERTIIRPVGTDNLLAVVIITIGLFIFLNALAGWIYGTDGRNFESPFPDESWSIGGVNITADDIGNLVVLGAVVFLMYLIFQKTKFGLGLRAVASNIESASLVGIRPGVMLMAGWGMAAALGALAGSLTAADRTFIELNLMQGVLIFAFAAATLGGFDSPLGAVVGGLIVGVVQALSLQYVGFFDGLEIAPAFVLILVVLLVKPTGLFGRKTVERV
jgi:branched-chain amino acid transport system permease protein